MKTAEMFYYSKYPGVVVGESLSGSNHVSYVASRSRVYRPKLNVLNRISSFLDHANF